MDFRRDLPNSGSAGSLITPLMTLTSLPPHFELTADSTEFGFVVLSHSVTRSWNLSPGVAPFVIRTSNKIGSKMSAFQQPTTAFWAVSLPQNISGDSMSAILSTD